MNQPVRLPSEAPPAEAEEGRVVHNSPELLQFLAQTLNNIRELRAEKKDTDTTISAAVEQVAARGIPKKAFRMALAYVELSPKDKEHFDMAYAIVRQAANEPLQLDALKQLDLDWHAGGGQ